MAQKPQFLQLPEDVMIRILEKLNFLAILNLHKTCHDFRNFIQDSPPESQIFGIQIIVDIDEISFHLDFDEVYEEFSERKIFRLSYKNQKSGVLVTWKLRTHFPEKSKFLKNCEIVQVFSKDLEVILRHVKSTLRYFDLHFRYPNDHSKRDHFKILGLFKNMKNPLKVRKFEFAGKGEHEVLEILPFFGPKSLKILKIDVGRKNGNLDLQETMYLEQWGGAKEVELIGCSTEPWNFEHFEKVEVSIQVVTTEQILGFREVLANSSTLIHVKIHFQHYYTENHLGMNFGPPSVHTDLYEVNVWKRWWIRDSKFEGKVIRVELHKNFLQLDEMNAEEVVGPRWMDFDGI